jgi:hypothetical protein
MIFLSSVSWNCSSAGTFRLQLEKKWFRLENPGKVAVLPDQGKAYHKEEEKRDTTKRTFLSEYVQTI